MRISMLQWQWSMFTELSNSELHEIFWLRQQIFIIEQQCIYEDIDDLDKNAWHLIGWKPDKSDTKNIMAYLRVLAPYVKYPEVSIGRVLIKENARKEGLGTQLMTQAIIYIEKTFPDNSIRLSAQSHLANFYLSHGFIQTSEPYDEDGIMHIDMLRSERQS